MCTVDVQKIDRPVGESTQRFLACRADKRRTVGVPSIALRHGLEHLLAVEAGLKNGPSRYRPRGRASSGGLATRIAWQKQKHKTPFAIPGSTKSCGRSVSANRKANAACSTRAVKESNPASRVRLRN